MLTAAVATKVFAFQSTSFDSSAAGAGADDRNMIEILH